MIPDSLVHKPDFSEAVARWEAFWQGEMIDRPPLVVTAPKEGVTPAPHPGYMAGRNGNYREALEQFDRWAETVYFGAEAVPFFDPCFGPDMIAAFVGAELKYDPNCLGTSWAIPFVEDWESELPLSLRGKDWPRMLEFVRTAAEVSRGRFLVGMLDLHSHLDCLSAIRGPEKLCMDLLDYPDLMDRVVKSSRDLFVPIYEGIFEAGDMANQGSLGWTSAYSPKRFATIQCDFICMAGPEMARRFIIPAIEEEAAYLDHTVYHYDGPQALIHLDDILAIPGIDVIQWIPGAGNPPLLEWMDLLKKIQSAGKALEIRCSPEEIPMVQKELDPKRLYYIVGTNTQKEAEALEEWLKENT